MVLLDGKKIAGEILQELKERVAALKERGFKVKLTAINVGEHEPSLVFLKIKEKRATEAGMQFELVNLPESVNLAEVLKTVDSVNQSSASAITFQLPLPLHLQPHQREILNSINAQKDVDLLTQENKKLFKEGRPRFLPPTAQGIIRLLESYNIDLHSHKILVIGQGELVGRPVSELLKQKGIEFDTADNTTERLDELVSQSTLIITATGHPGLVRADNIQDGAVIVDAGTAESEGKLVGDVDPSAFHKASYLTPVPGGVGPMTVAMLLSNVVQAAEQ